MSADGGASAAAAADGAVVALTGFWVITCRIITDRGPFSSHKNKNFAKRFLKDIRSILTQ